MKPSRRAKLMRRYPSIADLRDRARKRIPHVAWEYLDCGLGDEAALARTVESMRNVTLVPRFLKGDIQPEVGTTLFERSYAAPFGVAPIGLGG